MLYHRPGCLRMEGIKNRNKISLPWAVARRKGYRACTCCHGMDYHLRIDKHALDYYEKNKGLEFKYIDGILYIKSPVGCWKLVYARGKETIALYHRSATDKPLDFAHPQREIYHHQGDKGYCDSVASYLHYIYEHDRYKAAAMRGEKNIHFSNKKYKRAAAEAKRRREIRRVDELLRMLESQKKSIRGCPIIENPIYFADRRGIADSR